MTFNVDGSMTCEHKYMDYDSSRIHECRKPAECAICHHCGTGGKEGHCPGHRNIREGIDPRND